MFRRAVVIWVVILGAAFLNGLFRVAILIPAYGEQIGHVWSTLVLCTVILVATRKSVDWVHPDTLLRASEIGLLWVALTVSFEFLGGHYLFGAPWSKLLADYNIAGGRIWALVLVVTLVAPMWAYRVTHPRSIAH